MSTCSFLISSPSAHPENSYTPLRALLQCLLLQRVPPLGSSTQMTSVPIQTLKGLVFTGSEAMGTLVGDTARGTTRVPPAIGGRAHLHQSSAAGPPGQHPHRCPRWSGLGCPQQGHPLRTQTAPGTEVGEVLGWRGGLYHGSQLQP